jgi:hypothetical protein
MKSKIKYLLGSLILSLTLQSISAQNSVARIGYFMDNATHKHLMNPALVPNRGYFSYPALGATNFDIQSNFQLTQFLYPGLTSDGPLLTFMNENVTPDQFLSQLSPDNYFRLNQRLSLLSFGIYTGTTFWTFEVASRINAGINLPIGLFEFMKKGMNSTAGSEYEINNLTFSAGAIGEASLGSSFRIGENIRVGLKGKVLVGGARMVAGIDEMTIKMQPDQWTIDTKGLINLYGAGVEFNKNDQGAIDINGLPVNFNTANANMAGLGFGLDVGASYKPFEFLEVSAGIVDLGKISWNKNFNSVYRSSGNVSFNGLDGISLEQSSGSDPIGDQVTTLTENIMKMAEFKEVNEADNLVEKLTPTLNAGIEAGVLNNMFTLGVLYTNRMFPGNSVSEITGMLNFRPYSGLNLAASYSLLNGIENTLGLALAFNIGVANIFVACDYVPMLVTPQYIPLTKATTDIQIGLSVSLGKMKVKK